MAIAIMLQGRFTQSKNWCSVL